MNEELDKKLVETYPELYKNRDGDIRETLMGFGFEVGNGWYQIIDTLSCALTMSHRSAKDSLEYWKSNLDKEMWKGRVGTQEDIDKAQKKFDETPCPVAVQVKEKFGTLRFYVDGATDKHYNYIDFAELMSGRTCEECGKQGQTYYMGWHRTLCDEHADENYGDEAGEYRNKTGKWSQYKE
jgi:hypothetical protein